MSTPMENAWGKFLIYLFSICPGSPRVLTAENVDNTHLKLLSILADSHSQVAAKLLIAVINLEVKPLQQYTEYLVRTHSAGLLVASGGRLRWTNKSSSWGIPSLAAADAHMDRAESTDAASPSMVSADGSCLLTSLLQGWISALHGSWPQLSRRAPLSNPAPGAQSRSARRRSSWLTTGAASSTRSPSSTPPRTPSPPSTPGSPATTARMLPPSSLSARILLQPHRLPSMRTRPWRFSQRSTHARSRRSSRTPTSRPSRMRPPRARPGSGHSPVRLASSSPSPQPTPPPSTPNSLASSSWEMSLIRVRHGFTSCDACLRSTHGGELLCLGFADCSVLLCVRLRSVVRSGLLCFVDRGETLRVHLGCDDYGELLRFGFDDCCVHRLGFARRSARLRSTDRGVHNRTCLGFADRGVLLCFNVDGLHGSWFEAATLGFEPVRGRRIPVRFTFEYTRFLADAARVLAELSSNLAADSSSTSQCCYGPATSTGSHS